MNVRMLHVDIFYKQSSSCQASQGRLMIMDCESPALEEENLDLQVRNLDGFNLDHSRLFMKDIAERCSALFAKDSDQLASMIESIWKSDRIAKASELYPQFCVSEVEAIVDRDWKHMNQSQKQALMQQYTIDTEQVDLDILTMQEEINHFL